VLWNLTGAQVHATDHSNASRTMLMNLDSQGWDPMLLDLFGIPLMMPKIQPVWEIWSHRSSTIRGSDSHYCNIWRSAGITLCPAAIAGMVKCTALAAF